MTFFRRMEVLDHTKPNFKGTHQNHIQVIPYPLDNDAIFISIFWEENGKAFSRSQAITPEQAVALGEYLVKLGSNPDECKIEEEVIKI